MVEKTNYESIKLLTLNNQQSDLEVSEKRKIVREPIDITDEIMGLRETFN